jgi:hypothetical protein
MCLFSELVVVGEEGLGANRALTNKESAASSSHVTSSHLLPRRERSGETTLGKGHRRNGIAPESHTVVSRFPPFTP